MATLMNLLRFSIRRTLTTSSASPAPPQNPYEHLELYRAAIRTDWAAAERILEKDIEAAKAPITSGGETALHIAVMANTDSPAFVKKLLVPNFDLEGCVDNLGNTVLHHAALAGKTELADLFVNMNPKLLYMKSRNDRYPVHEAALAEHRGTLVYLLSVTKDDNAPYEGDMGVDLLYFIITAEFLDLAVDLVGRYPHLATVRPVTKNPPLKTIVEKRSSAFPSGYHFSLFEHFIYKSLPIDSTSQHIHRRRTDVATSEEVSVNFFWRTMIQLVPRVKKMHKLKMKHRDAIKLVELLLKEMENSMLTVQQRSQLYFSAVMDASRQGVPELLEMVIATFPEAIHCCETKGKSIFHEAVMHRCENVYNLTFRMGASKYHFANIWSTNWNSLLHLCAQLAPPDKLNLVSGAALQMQRELQWFQEVEKFVGAHIRKSINTDNKTPQQVFTEQHNGLKEAGEKWMRDTANSCILTATLIATVVFAAAITVPGGNDDGSGTPKWSGKTAFIVFAVSDAISLFTSTTSLLLFLSLLTSRYAEEDFLYTLPKRLSTGLLTLFLSITFMMLAFSSTLYLMFGHNKAWVLIPVAALACLPVTSFALLQFPLLVDVVYATYGPGIFGKQSDLPFY